MPSQDDKQRKKQFEQFLYARAEKAKQEGSSLITYGAPDEEPLAPPFLAANDVSFIWLPPDPQDILRIACGGGPLIPVNADYCVARGDIDLCIEQLRKSLAAMRQFKAVYEKCKQ